MSGEIVWYQPSNIIRGIILNIAPQDTEIGESIRRLVTTLEEELAGVIVGQRSVVRGVLTALLAGWTRAAGRRARPGQDSAGAHAGRRLAPEVSAASSSRPT